MLKVKCDSWVRGILRDPLDKSLLVIEDDKIVAAYGRHYPVVDGVFDLRVLNSCVGTVGRLWHTGQTAYESWSAAAGAASGENYVQQRRGMEDVYREIPIVGRCLDVGGNDGRLRAFLSPDQEYLSIDPYLTIIHEHRSPECKEVYPFLDAPLNFLAAFAEHLPVCAESFDVVHMRSVIDHFLNPELALREAYRVLRRGGYLVIGLSVRGGRRGSDPLLIAAKGLLRGCLVFVGLNRFRDHHIWHPTFDELTRLVSECGFQVEKVHWQASEHGRVCYFRANKL